ncbi:MAG: DinB family protein [Terracidiphilus sp.]
MPVSSSIANAAVSFKLNADFLKKNLEGLADEEWVRRPTDSINHILWIVGHLCCVRSYLLKQLGEDWSKPWLALYGRGKKPDDTVPAPTPQEAMLAWNESCERLSAAMESVSAETLATPSTNGPPSPDGMLSGVVNFLSYHETYHLGQASYIRAWLGHAGVMG